MTRAMVFRGTRGTRDFRARFDFDSIPLTYFFSSPFPSLVAERLDCCWIVVESTTVWQFRVETIASRRSKVSPLNTTEIRRSFFECIRETSFSKRRPKQTSVVDRLRSETNFDRYDGLFVFTRKYTRRAWKRKKEVENIRIDSVVEKINLHLSPISFDSRKI